MESGRRPTPCRSAINAFGAKAWFNTSIVVLSTMSYQEAQKVPLHLRASLSRNKSCAVPNENTRKNRRGKQYVSAVPCLIAPGAGLRFNKLLLESHIGG